MRRFVMYPISSRKFFLFLIVLTAVFGMNQLFCVNQLQAELVEHDFVPASGDALLLEDTDTGMVWLDLTATTNMSYSEASALLSSGGPTTGVTPVTVGAGEFRYATEDEIANLWRSVPIPEPYDGTTTSDKYAPVGDLMSLIGVLQENNYVRFTFALYGDGTYQAQLKQLKFNGKGEAQLGVHQYTGYIRGSYLVKTPSGFIDDFIEDIMSLVVAGILNPGQANGLIKPLENAQKSLAKDHVDAACYQLQDFIDEVYEKMNDGNGPLPLEIGESLIDDANGIMDAIGCNL
jgi:hypothetical protein